MVGSLLTEKWVYTDNDGAVANLAWSDSDNNVYRGDDFAGGLYACTDSCDENWGKLAEEWCDYWNDLKDIDNRSIFEELQKENVQSICYLYFALYVGMIFYSGFEIIGLICLVVWSVSMLLYFKKINCCLTTSFVCSGCVWTLHYLAFIFYMAFTESNFNGDCDDFDSETNPKLCASDGPALALFITIIIPIITIAYCIVGCNLKKKHGADGLHSKTMNEAALPSDNNITHTYPDNRSGYPSGPADIKY